MEYSRQSFVRTSINGEELKFGFGDYNVLRQKIPTLEGRIQFVKNLFKTVFKDNPNFGGIKTEIDHTNNVADLYVCFKPNKIVKTESGHYELLSNLLINKHIFNSYFFDNYDVRGNYILLKVVTCNSSIE